jgi:hypothetical protein
MGTASRSMPLIDVGPDDVEQLRLSVRSFGFGLLSDVIVPSVLRGMQEEAEERRNAAVRAERSADLRYRANIASLGPRARDFLCSRQLADLLSATFDGSFVLTEHRSCLTVYKEGDHLGPHLDKPAEECAVTIIVYVAATAAARRSLQTGLELRVYGQEMSRDGKARITIPTRTGGIVVGRGSTFWHERPMLEQGEQVAALTGCYRYATATEDTVGERTPLSERQGDPGAPSAQMADEE